MSQALDQAQQHVPASAADESADLAAFIHEQGYKNVCDKGAAGICATYPFLYTGALMVGLHGGGYVGRYCYATLGEAVVALAAWDGTSDPGGAWLKYKGTGGERLGPGIAMTASRPQARRRSHRPKPTRPAAEQP